MLALKITDVKDFMNKLLIGEVFDRFSLVEASVTTFNTFTINGKLHYDFFDIDTKAAFEENSTEYSLWHDVKPYCFSIIRGRRTPLNFRIVFELSHDQTQSLLKNEQHIADIPVQSFYLNIRYKNQSLLCTISLIPHAAEIARSHHERYDGKGYPDGLAGTEIPIHARIVAVADCYDAMNSRRIYRNALPPEVVYEEFRKNRGTQFDPKITDIFLKLLNEKRLPQWDPSQEEPDTYNLPDMQLTVSKFISDIMATIKSQEDAKSYDFLTGLPMRNLGERLTAEFMQTHDGCLIFLDMDNLKKINDIYGHKAGDRALKCLGKLLQKRADQGISCRLGGDEFLMFLPDTDPGSLSLQMDDLFQKFHTITTDDPELRFATLSAGLCLCSTDDSFEDCYSKADKALYYVKQNGKNQFFFYQQIDRSTLAASGSGKDLELVAESLQKSGIYVGALDLNYRDFARQYEYISQLVTRSQCRCYLAMITIETLVDTVPDIESIEQALEYMEQAIRQNIRRVDICTRYSSLQYLIILFEPDETHIPDIIERIFTQYYRQCDSHDFQPSYEYLKISPQEL